MRNNKTTSEVRLKATQKVYTARGTVSISPRRDGRYTASVTLGEAINGKRNRRTTTRNTEQEALKAGLDLIAKYHDKIVPSVAEVLTVSQLLVRVHHAYEYDKLEYSTQCNQAWLNQLVDKCIGDVVVQVLDKKKVVEMIDTLRKEHVESTVTKAYRHLRRALDVAVQQELVVKNCAREIKRPPKDTTPRVPEGWDKADVQRILMTTRQAAPKLYPLLLMAFASGTRIGELLGARLTDYDPASNTLTIEGTAKLDGGRGKGKTVAAGREITLPDAVRPVMLAHLEALRVAQERAGAAWGVKRAVKEETRQKQREAALKQHGKNYSQAWSPSVTPSTETYAWLFPTSRGTRMSAQIVARKWKVIIKQAGVPSKTFHRIRATWITAALNANRPLHEIQQAVGHASPEMVLRYAERPRENKTALHVGQELGLDDLDAPAVTVFK